MHTPVKTAALRPEDREAWEVLARGYKEFYATPTTDAEYSTAWERLLAQDGVHGLGAFVDGKLVGMAHYLFTPASGQSRIAICKTYLPCQAPEVTVRRVL